MMYINSHTHIYSYSTPPLFYKLEIQLKNPFFFRNDQGTHLQNLRTGIHRNTPIIRIHNEDHIHTILHYFSTNIIRFVILSSCSILSNEELIILNSWARKFIYNLSDTIKVFWILLLTNFFIGFHSTRGWELISPSTSTSSITSAIATISTSAIATSTHLKV